MISLCVCGFRVSSFCDNKSLIHIKGDYVIDRSIKDSYFICDSTTKIVVAGGRIEIVNCIFDANGHSVNRSLIECKKGNVSIKKCTIKNINSRAGKGAYGIFVNVENCTSIIKSCSFFNITDTREETDPFGYIKGMCGAIYYSTEDNVLHSKPHKQTAIDIEINYLFTSTPEGNINFKSNDADGIRVFINDTKTKKEYFDAQNYSFKNIRGADIQKRLIKISGASNCSISNVVYLGNEKLPNHYPSHLIAVFDSDKILINKVNYKSGCNNIAFCAGNSSNVSLNKIEICANETTIRTNPASLFYIDECKNLELRNITFTGGFQRLGRLYNSEGIYIQLKGDNIFCSSPIEIKDSKNVKLSGELNNVEKNKKGYFLIDNVEGLSIKGGLKKLDSKLFKYNDSMPAISE